MAYFNQEMKKEKAPSVKAVLKKYGIKGTLAVDNFSTFVVNLKSGKLDIVEDYISTGRIDQGSIDYLRKSQHIQVNPYYTDEQYTGKVKEFMRELIDAMMVGNHNNSDIMTDYFDVGWYISINVGKWDKPYIVEK